MTDETKVYVCGDCGRLRKGEDIEMKNFGKKYGNFPICADSLCSIENVNPTGSNEEESNLRDSDEFRVDKELK
jgi:hypothetical protein